MADMKVRHVETLLADFLGPKKEITDVETSSLTQPGENYGSVMLKLDLTVKNAEDGREEILHAVAKVPPPHEGAKKAFNCQVTFKSEAAIYTTIVPTLRLFQKEVGVQDLIDWSADVYGARFNLNDSEVVDDDACLLLENLKTTGFVNIDRMKGFDLETTKMILRSLASFHAVPLALKLTRPQVFEEKIKRHIGSLELPSELFEEFIRKVLDQNEKFKDKFPELNIWREKPPAREPWATMTHNDLWTNNTMQKFVDGKPISNRLVDFQAWDYGSPASDLYFFLFSSVNLKVLKENLDYFIKYYHEHFFQLLKAHGCDTGPFGYDAFIEELKIQSKHEFGHTMLFCTFVHQSEKSKNSRKENKGPSNVEAWMNILTPSGLDQAYYMAEVCLERGWY